MSLIKPTIAITRPPTEMLVLVADLTSAPSCQPGRRAVRRSAPGPVGDGHTPPTGTPQEGGRP